MKKLFIASLSVLVAVVFCFLTTEKVFAANKNKQVAQTLQVFANDGTDEFNGSVLSPKEDEANVFLSKPLLAKIRKIGLRNLSVNLVSTVDSTKTYTVPNDAIVIQRKTLNKKSGKYLVVSLFNLTTPSGITISPSSLPNDTYKLTISGKELNATTASFIYRTPALIVGAARTESTGLVTIKDLNGDQISDKTVATNLNGTFFTEVRAKKITPNTKARRYLKAQTTEEGATSESTATEENTTVEEINAAICEVTAEKELKAVVALNNDPEINAAISSKPVEVNESSTLAANLAIKGAEEGNEDLAVETAKAQLEGLQNTDETNDSFNDVTNEEDDLGCNIDQFADGCSDNEQALVSIGADFKKFLGSANCNFPEFGLIKKIILASPDSANSYIGKGYCEHVSREVNNDKPCEIYSEILRRHESGKETGLPLCPPPSCTQFQNIRPPKCFEPRRFCDEHRGPEPVPYAQVCRGPNCPRHFEDQCIHEPIKDLYCKEIDVDIKREECTSNTFDRYGPKWTIAKNSKGNEYCVPENIGAPPPPPIYSSSNFKGQFIPPPYTAPLPSYTEPSFSPPPPPAFTGNFGPPPFGPRSPENIAEECELNKCHNDCAVKFGFTSGPIQGPILPGSPLESASRGLSDCHFACDADAGRVADCGNPLSKYFKKECCDPYAIGPVVYSQSTLAAQLSGYGGYSNQSFGGGKPGGYSGGYSPGGNYNPGRGPIPTDVRGCLCQDLNNFDEKRYVKEEAQSICKNSCPKGYEKDPNSDQCLPICSEGAVRDPGGICRKKCPEGSFDDGTGYCRCPEGQSVGASGKCEVPTCPAYCKNYVASGFGSTPGNYSPTPYGTSSTPGYPSPGYTPSSYSSGYNPQTPGGSTYQIPPECQKCLGGGGSGICSPGQRKDPTTGQCVAITCGSDQNVDGNGVCRCSDGSVATSLGPEGCKKQNNNCGNSNMYPNPNYTPGSNQAQCICPDGLPYWETNYNPTPGSGGGRCVAHCSNGDPPASASANYPAKSPIPCSGGTQTNYCSPGISTTTGCTCWPNARVGTSGVCECTTTGQAYTKEYGCGSSTACPPATPFRCSDNVTCAVSLSSCPNTCPPATPFRCTNGSCATSLETCGSTNCPAPYVTNPSGSPPCKCPDDRSIQHNGTCVVSCPAGLIADYPQYSTPSTSMRSCLCPDKSYPNANGTCGSTTNYCSPGIAIGTNGCTCNLTGGTLSTSGFCGCPSGSNTAYTKETGCSSTSCPSATPFRCTNGSCATSLETCGSTNCPSPYIKDPAFPNGGCICPQNQFELGSTCVAQCPANLTPSTSPGGPYSSTRQVCKCQDGTYPTGNGTCTSSSNYCSPGIAIGTNGCTCNLTGGTLSTSGFCGCPSGSNTAYTKETGCSSTSRPCTAGEGPSNNCYCFGSATVVNGTCQCPNNNNPAYTGGGCGSSQESYCPIGQGPSNGCQCNTQGGTIVGSNGQCQCPSGSSQSYSPASGCGTSTSSHVCAAGEAATTTNPCYCVGGATFTGPSGTGTCQCPNNNTPAYTAAGCGSTSTSSCPPPYVSNPSGSPPCKCPDSTPIINGSTCVAACPSPLTSQAGPSGQQSCLCPGGAYPTNGTCPQQCTGGQIYDPAISACRCPNNQTLSNGVCSCPAGTQVDPNSSNNCISCPACTGGKVFSGSGCTCSCPTGKTEVNSVCQ